jgi:PhoH-like ATPase
VDEAQNLTKHEAKTMVTRAGEGAKIVLMGDPEQIDKPGLDSLNNGLTWIVNKFKDQDVAGHITLDKTVRSKLADVASNIL